MRGYTYEKASGIEMRARIMVYLRAYVAEHGYMPKLSEIATACITVPTNIERHLYRLKRAGLLARPQRGRWVLVDPPMDTSG